MTAGIDVGTTSVKAVAVDDTGSVVGRSRVVHGFRTPAPGRLEHDATAWRTGPLRALEELRAQVDGLDALCVAAMVPSLTAVDETGAPL
ncbi:MAG: FGGY family carbohydrate kinase, partial [Nitriliruptorales bacterium]|nr:FGGY family carbohydrate kinase [Nitriliruptorales bacterium]